MPYLDHVANSASTKPPNARRSISEGVAQSLHPPFLYGSIQTDVMSVTRVQPCGGQVNNMVSNGFYWLVYKATTVPEANHILSTSERQQVMPDQSTGRLNRHFF